MTVVAFKSSRRTVRKPQAKTLRLFEQIRAVTDEYPRMSVRQLFYQMVVRGHLEKTEQAYGRVCEATVAMRRSKRLPYSKIVDGGRVRRRLPGWDSLGELLSTAQQQFRLDHWAHQSELVEIWCEKDGLGGVIMPVTDAYGVTFVALRGFGSVSIAAESGEELRRDGKTVNLYYYGDHDPSGWAVSQAIEAELRDHLGDLLRFTRVGLNPEQIAHYGLPTRLPKKGDKRNAAFVAAFGSPDCVELDALPPRRADCLGARGDRTAHRLAVVGAGGCRRGGATREPGQLHPQFRRIGGGGLTGATLGRVGGELATSLAYLTSPSRIDAEIRFHEAAIAAGDHSAETATLLRDWRAIRAAQRRLYAGEEDAVA